MLIIRSSLLALLLLSGCAGSQKTVSSVETDLCKARAAFRVAEALNGSLTPEAGSQRFALESAEDTFCESLK